MTHRNALAFMFLSIIWVIHSFNPALCAESFSFAEVKIGSTNAFEITDSPTMSADQRALQTNRTILALLRDPSKDPSTIDAHTIPGGDQVITLGTDTILQLSPKDAQIFGKSETELAMDWSSILRMRMTQLKPLYLSHGKHAHSSSSPTKPLADEKVMLFLIEIAILLTAAVVSGEVLARMGQPAVIGQLLAGIILGPSVLGAIFPQAYSQIFPIEHTQQYLIDIISWLGVIFLLMLTGTETDIALIKKQSKVAIATAMGATILPLAAGFLVSYLLPEDMLVLPNQRLVLGAFLGTVFSVSSVTVIAKILLEMKLLRRNIGQAILASALVQDLSGCVLLALVAAIAGSGGGPLSLIKMPIGIALFALIGATIGRRVVLDLFRWVQDRSHVDYAAISLVVILLMLSAAITQFIGVNVILGAFAVGVLLAQSPLVGEKVLHPLEAVTMGIFAPVFFAAAGLHVNLTLLRDPKLLGIAIAVTLIACLAKILGGYAGGIAVKMGRWESLSVAFGTNARGAMGLIVGILGFSLGILTVNLFTVIVLMSLVSTAIAPFLLRYSLPKITATSDEIERLEREEKQSKSFVKRIHRLLLPVKQGSRKHLSSRLVAALGQQHAIEATAMTVYSESGDSEEFVSKTLATSSKEGNVTLVNRSLQSNQPAVEILKEAKLNYDLIVLESTRAPSHSSVFSPIIDEVAKSSPCPLLIVRESAEKPDWNIKKILVPTTGRWQTGKAAELAVLLAKNFDATVTSLFVIEQKNISYKSLLEDLDENNVVAKNIVEQVTAIANAFEVEADSIVKVADNPTEEILRVVKEQNIDLVVLGARVRPSARLFLGNTVRVLVEKLPCNLAILSPEGIDSTSP